MDIEKIQIHNANVEVQHYRDAFYDDCFRIKLNGSTLKITVPRYTSIEMRLRLIHQGAR